MFIYETSSTNDPSISAGMDEIEEQVSQLRGLNIESVVPRQLMTRDELNQVVLNDFLEDYSAEDEEKDILLMSLFGLLPADFPLRDFYLKMYGEQIAGFYDAEQKAMFIISDSGFGGMERSTYAHEFVHALQDEHFDFEGKLGYTDESCAEDSERCMAIQSLLEGDATLTQQLWFQNYSTKQDLQDLQAYTSSFSSPVYDSAPDSIKESLTFPYLYGGTFVQSLYARGGFDAIDTAFTTLQPVSSEQIMHPSRYPDDLPDNPTLPDLQSTLGGDWEEVDNDVLGEWYIYLILAKSFDQQHRLFDSLALDAAEGWGGDAYSVVKNKHTGEQAAYIAMNWDTAADSDAAFRAFSDYSNLRFGLMKADGFWQGEDYSSTLIKTSSTSFVWLMAQDRVTLQSLKALVGD